MRPVRGSESIQVQEFVAHATQVNCVSIGPKSSQVLATGGEDAKVNIWRVGSAANIWSLGQNKSPVECLCFDSDEVCVVSGAMNGSLKVFDLNVGKLARNLGTHQTNVTSVQYHPYGEFIASGSADCSMKLWDVRNKACIETYTGHTKEVTCVRFSPDGKWLASASKDGTIIFWDLIASKHIDTIKLAPNYLTSFEFNPAELSMAASTSSRTVRLFDLESMKGLAYTPPESALVRSIAFNNLGNQMFTTVKNVLKVWDIDSSLRLAESFDIGWGDRVAEIKVSNNDTIIAASFSSNFVSVWEVDLDGVRSEDPSPPREGGNSGRESKPVAAMGTPSGRAQDKEYKDSQAEKESVSGRHPAPPKSTSSAAAAAITYKDLYEEYKDAPARRPAPPRGAHLPDLHEEANDREGIDEPLRGFDGNGLDEDEDEEEEVGDMPNIGSPPKDLAASVGESFWKKFKDSLKDKDMGETEELGIPNDELDDLLPPSNFHQPVQQSTPSTGVSAKKNTNVSAAARASPAVITGGRAIVSPSAGGGGKPSAGIAPRGGGGGFVDDKPSSDHLSVVGMRHLRLDSANNRFDEAPHGAANGGGGGGGAAAVAPPPPARTPTAGGLSTPSTPLVNPAADPAGRITNQCHTLLDSLLATSAKLPADLSNRLTSLRVLRQLWTKGQVLDAIDHLQGICDAMKLNNPQQVYLLADFFSAVELRPNGCLSLDACVQVLPILNDMLANSTSWHAQSVVLTVYKVLANLLEAFGELIRNTRSIIVTGGVDIQREARLTKCNACHAIFTQARSRSETLKHQFRQNASVAEVLETFQRLCSTYCS